MLKSLMLRKKISDTQKELEELRNKSAEFETREAEIETAINEADTDETRAAVDEAIDAFETERSEHDAKVAELTAEIERMENELAELERNQPKPEIIETKVERKENHTMETRKFFSLNAQERTAFFENNDVKDFLARTRELGTEKRAVSGAELLVPTVVLDLIRENIQEYSKLYKHVNVRAVPGKARQSVMGVIPEGIWTEMTATLKELTLNFTGVEVDGYRVGGFIPVCNGILEDSDIALATEIIAALGRGIGLALDKAILFGTGTKMPVGIYTRLAQTADPGNDNTTIPWTDLHTSNIVSASGKTDTALFKAIVAAAGAAKGKYSHGAKFWAMNETTYSTLLANAVSVNAAGAIVGGFNAQMPLVGGEIVVLDFVPDNAIIGGYGDLYLLAERAGTALATSEHARFAEDQVVFRGTARYDGLPVIAEGFVAINLGTAAITPPSFAG